MSDPYDVDSEPEEAVEEKLFGLGKRKQAQIYKQTVEKFGLDEVECPTCRIKLVRTTLLFKHLTQCLQLFNELYHLNSAKVAKTKSIQALHTPPLEITPVISPPSPSLSLSPSPSPSPSPSLPAPSPSPSPSPSLPSPSPSLPAQSPLPAFSPSVSHSHSPSPSPSLPSPSPSFRPITSKPQTDIRKSDDFQRSVYACKRFGHDTKGKIKASKFGFSFETHGQSKLVRVCEASHIFKREEWIQIQSTLKEELKLDLYPENLTTDLCVCCMQPVGLKVYFGRSPTEYVKIHYFCSWECLFKFYDKAFANLHQYKKWLNTNED
jgi:hypothetical protein